VPLSWNLGSLTSWNPLRTSSPVTGLIYLYYLCCLSAFSPLLFCVYIVQISFHRSLPNLLYLCCKRQYIVFPSPVSYIARYFSHICLIYWILRGLLCIVVSCLVCIVVSCLVCIVVVVLCVLLSSYLYLLYYVCIAVFTSDAVLLARSHYSEGPATGHLDTGFSWFPSVYKQMLRWFPRFQVATTCFSCRPPDLNLLVTNFIFWLHVK